VGRREKRKKESMENSQEVLESPGKYHADGRRGIKDETLALKGRVPFYARMNPPPFLPHVPLPNWFVVLANRIKRRRHVC
jgi:hypothetical protein